MPPNNAKESQRTAHLLRRAYEASRTAYDRAKAIQDPWERLDAMRLHNDFMASVATQEAEISLGRWKA